MADPLKLIIGTPVGVSTSVVPEKKHLDVDGDGWLERHEVSRYDWYDIVARGRQAQNEGFLARVAKLSPEAAAGVTTLARAGMSAEGLGRSVAATAKWTTLLAPVMTALGPDVWSSGHDDRATHLWNLAGTFLYDAASSSASASVGAAVGITTSPFVTPVGGAIAGAATTYASKQVLDMARDRVVELCYMLFTR
jgi:hypothetical protein